MKWFAYLLASLSSGKKYVGSTNDLERRLHEHNSGKSKYTSSYSDWEIIYFESIESEKEARTREQQIKKNKKHRLEFYRRARVHALPV